MTEYTAIHDARPEIASERACLSVSMAVAIQAMAKHGELPSYCRDDLVASAGKLLRAYGIAQPNLTRSGNLSPTYLLAQDRARRESEAPTRVMSSANGGTAA